MNPVWHPLGMALETAVVLLAAVALVLGTYALAARVAYRGRGPGAARGSSRD